MTEAGASRRGRLSPAAVILVLCLAAIVAAGLPTPAGMEPRAHRLISATIVIAGLWMTQALPLAVTSLLPLVLFPLLGILTPEETARTYANDSLFLYFGGMILALGIERWNLHRRIALGLIAWIGTGPRKLVLGFMLASAGLSMWISNTACTLMMLPIALALLKTLDDAAGPADSPSGAASVLPTALLAPPLLLAIAYGSSLGGMTTLVGTPTNVVAVRIYREELPGAPEVSVAQWITACAPLGFAYLAFTWWLLTRRLPQRSAADLQMKQEIDRRRQRSGRATPAEYRMLTVFGLTATLWVLRKPLTTLLVNLLRNEAHPITGVLSRLWNPSDLAAALDSPGAIATDTTVAMFFALLLFVIPSGTRDSQHRRIPLMNWETTARLPWDMILLFGGGFALAAAFQATGLSAWIGNAMQGPLAGKPVWLVIATVCLMMTFLTEVTSNVATVNAVMPILLQLATALHIDPRLIMVPATLAASCAFMLPVATPPNAIVFGSGLIPAGRMAGTGLILNLVGVPLLTAGTFLIVRPALNISTIHVAAMTEPAQSDLQPLPDSPDPAVP